MDKELSPIVTYSVVCSIIGALIGIVVLFVYGIAHWPLIVRVIFVVGVIVIGFLIGFLIGDVARRRQKNVE